jgi:hypothetical protein
MFFRYSFIDIFHYLVLMIQNICNAALWKAKLLAYYDLYLISLDACETSYCNPTSNDVHTCILIFMVKNILGWGWGRGVYHHYDLTLVDINHHTNSRK